MAQLPLFNDRSSLIRACGLESKSFQKNLLHCPRLWHMLTSFISDDGTSSVLCNIKGRRIQKVRLTNREECEKYSWIFYWYQEDLAERSWQFVVPEWYPVLKYWGGVRDRLRIVTRPTVASEMSTILSHFIKSLVFYSVSSGETLSQNTVKTVSAEWQSCENCGEFFFYANQDRKSVV